MRSLALLVLLPISLCATESWLRVSTPHFEMYSSTSEGKAREAVLYIEQVRAFFQQASSAKKGPEMPVRIIAFRGEKQFRPYRINEFATAYYTGTRDRDYIVMQDISSEHYSEAIHEYAHLVIRHSGLKLPVWMNEGWADLYSTIRPVGDQARVGDVPPGYLRTLAARKWLPLEVLTSASQQSPYYSERDKAGVFYAQSWALMHMLYFDPRYRANFNRFVASLAVGEGFAEACREVLAVPMAEVEEDLKRYFTARNRIAAIVNVKLVRPNDDAIVTPLNDFDSRLILADLLVFIGKAGEAKDALIELGRVDSTRPEIEESFGYLAWQQHDLNGAREHFGKAVAQGTRDPRVCYQFALMEPSDLRVGALQRAVSLRPEFTDAWMQLGLALLNQRDYPAVLAALNHVRNVDEDQASKLFGARAYALAETGRLAEARQNARDAKKWARTPLDSEQASSILRYVERVEAAR